MRLVATAALTNVALLLALYPEVLPMIEVVLMGGCLGVGNTGGWHLACTHLAYAAPCLHVQLPCGLCSITLFAVSWWGSDA